ncbi:hypothetical protein GCM10010832_18210 [Psychroflexus planctonicus]|uniref:Uncharacterized protein n=1 Tax=Psychroflexus planctonicus TaxID=1526575 RepID=A0ABQ1SIN5_9FLAO|nr:hypothetical protein GCM10010832_18210 [Psychroflexus planctonicus]
MVKCCAKNKTRNNPDKAIATFRAIEDLIPPMNNFFKNFTKNTADGSQIQAQTIILHLFRIDLSDAEV